MIEKLKSLEKNEGDVKDKKEEEKKEGEGRFGSWKFSINLLELVRFFPKYPVRISGAISILFLNYKRFF